MAHRPPLFIVVPIADMTNRSHVYFFLPEASSPPGSTRRRGNGWKAWLRAFIPSPIPFQDNEGMHRPWEQEEGLIELHSFHRPPGHRLWLQWGEEVGEPECRKRHSGFLQEKQLLLRKVFMAVRSGSSLWLLEKTWDWET